MAPQLLDPHLQAILRVLRQGLVQTIGYELEQVILYGSQARGESRPDSDIDVLIIIRGTINYPDLMQRTSTLVADVSLQHDVVISRTFASQSEWKNAQTPFLINVRREGVAV
jgi:uncharacterized protein